MDYNSMFDKLPPEILQTFWGTAGVMALAWLGRMAWHVKQVQMRRRKFFSAHLLFETITALFMGFIADGVITYMGWDGKIGLAAIIIIAYVGPRGVETLLVSWGEKYGYTLEKDKDK